MFEFRHLDVSRHGGCFMVRLPEHRLIHQQQIQEMAGELHDLAAREDCQAVMLDLSNVERLSSEILGKLLGLNKRLQRRQASLTLCGVKPTLRTVLAWTKLDQVFRINENASQGSLVTA